VNLSGLNRLMSGDLKAAPFASKIRPKNIRFWSMFAYEKFFLNLPPDVLDKLTEIADGNSVNIRSVVPGMWKSSYYRRPTL